MRSDTADNRYETLVFVSHLNCLYLSLLLVSHSNPGVCEELVAGGWSQVASAMGKYAREKSGTVS